ncbi:S8 family serine peptidase [Actinophytocola oryzae]|uniref:Subtilisin family serine protease n=1 Tax=Actinophytocola oryzae TaxID=502181 RepID=A0A4R7VZ97_9PSEU|nr:S8 family serine peptidase [Actinophytocola oryzae]TDV55434.1 subtilisin family serine protease [Actinophytocola oryzae]
MRRVGFGVVALGLVFATTPAVHANPLSTKESPDRQITLLTGDRVVVDNGRARQVIPGRGRDGMAFSVHRTADHLYVIPADALRAVASGQVDRRLFDIRTLTDFGYAGRDTVPLIVTGSGATRVAAEGRTLSSIDGVAYDAAKGDAWRTLTTTRGVSRIWLDGKRKAVLDHSVPQIGAPAAWAAGYTGAGVKVAVIDTGVDQTHPDLANQQLAEANFSGTPDNADHYGHGTHVASIVAGTGAKSGGRYRGVADGAGILDAKVLDDNGSGQDSWIIAGMEWAVEQGADIANLSLGGTDTPEIDPLEEAVNELSASSGTLFVVAAGNSFGDGTIGSPGSADAALTVGAVDREDELADFSSRGPRVGDGAIKPDVTAPGVDIVAALHSDGTVGEPVEPGYTALSGTSMATPHVAGAAALLAQQHPDYTGQQLKELLSASASPHADLTAFQQGAGRIDVARAITQTVTTDPANVSIGKVEWPHDDDVPVTRSVTYTNDGDAAVTLALSLDTTAPQGMFSLGADEVTVPAGGTAEVQVTADAGAGEADGYFSAAVVATEGDSVTRTPVALDREVESYDLTIDSIDATGAPASGYNMLVVGLDNSTFQAPYDEDGSVTLRLPKGQYLIDDIVSTAGGEDRSYGLLVQPVLVLDEDTAVTFDARTAKPVRVTPPAEATLSIADLGYSMVTDIGSMSSAFLTDDLGLVNTAHVGAPVPGTAFTGKVNTQWTGADGSFYGLAWFPHGTMPTGFSKVVTDAELATVTSELGATTPDRTGGKVSFPFPAEGDGFVFGVAEEVTLPGKRVEHLTTDGVRWQGQLTQNDGEKVEAQLTSPFESYQAGVSYVRPFNHAVFGPTMTDDGFPGGWVYRVGDQLVVSPALYGDKAGNAGQSVLSSAKFELYRDGQPIASGDQAGGSAEVPKQDGEYRAVVTTTRPREVFGLSTGVTVAWTFHSSYVDDETVVPLPVSAIRFTPDLDAANSAQAGVRFLVPVWLQHNGTGAVDRPRTLSVEASYDEGATWQEVETPMNMVAQLDHPADAASVSLRATATDAAGNSVTQTVIRAYTLRK